MAGFGFGFIVFARKEGEVRVVIARDKRDLKSPYSDEGESIAAVRELPFYRGTALLTTLAEMTESDIDDDTLANALEELIQEAFLAGRENKQCGLHSKEG